MNSVNHGNYFPPNAYINIYLMLHILTVHIIARLGENIYQQVILDLGATFLAMLALGYNTMTDDKMEFTYIVLYNRKTTHSIWTKKYVTHAQWSIQHESVARGLYWLLSISNIFFEFILKRVCFPFIIQLKFMVHAIYFQMIYYTRSQTNHMKTQKKRQIVMVFKSWTMFNSWYFDGYETNLNNLHTRENYRILPLGLNSILMYGMFKPEPFSEYTPCSFQKSWGT